MTFLGKGPLTFRHSVGCVSQTWSSLAATTTLGGWGCGGRGGEENRGSWKADTFQTRFQELKQDIWGILLDC